MTHREYLQGVCSNLVNQLTNDLDRTEEEIIAKTIRLLATDKATKFYHTWAVYWDNEFNAWLIMNLIDRNKIITKYRNNDEPPQIEAIKSFFADEVERLKATIDELETLLSNM